MKRIILLCTSIAVLSLTACTGSTTSSTAERTASGPASPSASAVPAAMEPSAHVGDCFATSVLFQFADVPDPVPCEAGGYTEKTVAILKLPADLSLTYPERQALADVESGGDELTSAQMAQVGAFRDETGALYTQCETAVRRLFSLPDYRDTLFSIDVTGPNEEQWNAGERWARCNLTRMLPSDAERTEDRLLPLPQSLSSGVASAYTNQLCWLGSGKKYEIHFCDGPDFRTRGAWLRVLNGMPMATLGAFPGTEKKANAMVVESCIDLSRPYVQPAADLTKNDYIFTARAPGWNGPGEMTLKDVWDDPDGQYGCSIPNWSYRQAPSA